MTVSTLRIVIADDERPARRFLAGLIKGCTGVTLVGEAASGEEALEMIERLRPDLALLDLQMPEVGGLDVVRRLPAERLPLVAFVTAFDDYAIEAFELNAIDYVLKAAERDRVQATVDRARARLAGPETPQARAASLGTAAAAYERVEPVVVDSNRPVRERARDPPCRADHGDRSAAHVAARRANHHGNPPERSQGVRPTWMGDDRAVHDWATGIEGRRVAAAAVAEVDTVNDLLAPAFSRRREQAI
jgi:CheY-like chemotaxis protein